MNLRLAQLLLAACVGLVPAMLLPVGSGLGQVYKGTKPWRKEPQ